MKRSKLFITGMFTTLALIATMTSTAAAKPEFLDNVKGNTFKGNGGSSVVEVLGGGLTASCKENTVEGEITGSEEGTIKNINFKGCGALGFKENSLGDAEGSVLTGEIKFKLCYINEAKKEVGIYLEQISIHKEVPALVGVLINVTGSIIGKIDTINKLQTTTEILFTQTAAGDQSPVTCTLLGKELKASLLLSKDAKHEKNESTSLRLSDTLTFAKDIEVMA